MNKAQESLVAVILVRTKYADAGYSDYPHLRPNPDGKQWVQPKKGIHYWIRVDITSNTFEAMKQLNVVEDWLVANHINLWRDSRRLTIPLSQYAWRKERALWCLDRLVGY